MDFDNFYAPRGAVAPLFPLVHSLPRLLLLFTSYNLNLITFTYLETGMNTLCKYVVYLFYL